MGTPRETQFEELKAQFPGAELKTLPSGAALVVIKDYKLPGGWNQSLTDIKFLVPVGYPQAKPDCFWCSPNLRLANNSDPQASNMQAVPELPGEPQRWFSRHVGSWDPNKDSLLSYLRVIIKRLQEPR